MPTLRSWLNTLVVRFLLIYVASLGGTIVTLGVYQYVIVRQALYRQVEQSGANAISVLQVTLSEFPEMLETEKFALILKELTTAIPGLDRISIVNPAFRIVADTDEARIGELTDQNALIEVLRTLEGSTFFYSRGNANYFRLHRTLQTIGDRSAAPTVIGAVTVDIALASVDMEVTQSFWQIMGILSALLVVTALPMLWLMYRRIIQPVLNLARAADRIAEGQLDAPLPLLRDDEIGRLAASFGNMVTRLKNLLTGLEERVAERTEELETSHEQLSDAYQSLQDNQRKLLISEKMASLGRLTAGIAHEMNTPLAAVRSAMARITRLIAEYQASAGDPEVAADDHRAIAADMLAAARLADTAAERAAGFVRGIKAQTRDLGAQPPVRFKPVPVVEEALLLLGHAFSASGHRVVFEHDESAVRLVGSPGRLAQVVTNLVMNAIESMPEPGGTVRLRMTELAGVTLLAVSDTGCGIEPEVLPRIFDPLFTTKGMAQGTGLGLTIIHDIIISEFDGSIDVETQVGVGTTMTVRLPSSQEH